MNCERCTIKFLGRAHTVPLSDNTEREVCDDCYEFLIFVARAGRGPATSALLLDVTSTDAPMGSVNPRTRCRGAVPLGSPTRSVALVSARRISPGSNSFPQGPQARTPSHHP